MSNRSYITNEQVGIMMNKTVPARKIDKIIAGVEQTEMKKLKKSRVQKKVKMKKVPGTKKTKKMKVIKSKKY